MKTLKITITSILMMTLIVSESYSRQFFNKNKDLLLANFDLKPDEDDVHAVAALGCMLKHSDLSGVNYYAVAGAFGTQGGTYITTTTPGLFNDAFGAQNQKWTDAEGNWSASLNRVRDKVKAVLNSGGKVFIQEAGQSDFTHDMLKRVIDAGVSSSVIKSKVIVVQHSQWNEDKTTGWKLNWVKNNTDYVRLDDGNKGGNNTPAYKNKDKKWLNQAKSGNNANTFAKNLWTKADNICDSFTASYENPTISSGGVDYSDCVENWWIFNIGSNANSVNNFWSRYVTNSNGGGSSGGSSGGSTSGGSSGGNSLNILAIKGNKYVTPQNNSGNNGAKIVKTAGNSGNHKKWNLVGGGTYKEIKNVATGKCIGILGGSTANGGKAVQWSCIGSKDQRWKQINRGNNQVSFQNEKSGKCLDVTSSGWNNVQLEQQNCDANNTSQRFKLQSSSSRITSSIDDLETSSISVYPNPVDNMLNISNVSEGGMVKIVSTIGEVVFEGYMTTTGIDVSDLTSGIYTVIVDNQAVRFIKE